ncbi:MAG: hypothetical protein JNJ73_00100 [Hyphomonadaceae bacterium]|nr:hypothetical protein [Hyphomonadaceae bacterium]
MSALRLVAILLALSLMIGEAYRSWGAGRPAPLWLDDMFAGALLIGSALALRQETPARRAFFTGAWGVAAGLLYGSFFGKVFEPQTQNAGNFPLGLLTVLVGAAFAVAVAGFVFSLLIPFRSR